MSKSAPQLAPLPHVSILFEMREDHVSFHAKVCDELAWHIRDLATSESEVCRSVHAQASAALKTIENLHNPIMMQNIQPTAQERAVLRAYSVRDLYELDGIYGAASSRQAQYQLWPKIDPMDSKLDTKMIIELLEYMEIMVSAFKKIGARLEMCDWKAFLYRDAPLTAHLTYKNEEPGEDDVQMLTACAREMGWVVTEEGDGGHVLRLSAEPSQSNV